MTKKEAMAVKLHTRFHVLENLVQDDDFCSSILLLAQIALDEQCTSIDTDLVNAKYKDLLGPNGFGTLFATMTDAIDYEDDEA